MTHRAMALLQPKQPSNSVRGWSVAVSQSMELPCGLWMPALGAKRGVDCTTAAAVPTTRSNAYSATGKGALPRWDLAIAHEPRITTAFLHVTLGSHLRGVVADGWLVGEELKQPNPIIGFL